MPIAYYVRLKGEDVLLGVDLTEDEQEECLEALRDDLAHEGLSQCSAVKSRAATRQDIADDASRHQRD